MKIVTLFVLFGLIGCTPKVVYIDRPVEVKVMVPVPCPEPPKIQRPTLHPVKPDATPQEVAEAALRSVVALMGYSASLEAILEGYRKPVVK